jgi:hypothetical protein
MLLRLHCIRTSRQHNMYHLLRQHALPTLRLHKYFGSTHYPLFGCTSTSAARITHSSAAHVLRQHALATLRLHSMYFCSTHYPRYGCTTCTSAARITHSTAAKRLLFYVVIRSFSRWLSIIVCLPIYGNV